MYQRIKNRLDVEIIKESSGTEKVDNAVLKRVEGLVEVLDREYGCGRGSGDMGGYVLFFTDPQAYGKYIPKVMEFYHLTEDSAEYSEVISGTENGRGQWKEELYLLSSDDALVLIYPKIQG